MPWYIQCLALFSNDLDIVLSILGACYLDTQIKNLYTSVSLKNINSLWIKSRNVHLRPWNPKLLWFLGLHQWAPTTMCFWTLPGASELSMHLSCTGELLSGIGDLFRSFEWFFYNFGKEVAISTLFQIKNF